MVAAVLLAIGGAAAYATCDGRDEVKTVTVTPPRALRPGEAFALVVETQGLAVGDQLAFRDERGELLGSVIGTLTGAETQRQTLSLIRDMPEGALTFTAEVVIAGSNETRAPAPGELLTLELVPMEVDP